MRIEVADRMADMRLVHLGPQCTFLVGDEKGTLNAKVVTKNVTSPKYQILCSVQTPCLRE